MLGQSERDAMWGEGGPPAHVCRKHSLLLLTRLTTPTTHDLKPTIHNPQQPLPIKIERARALDSRQA